MDLIWEFLSRNPWLFLILLGVVGQVFTPNSKKRQQARERERERRRQQESQQQSQPPQGERKSGNDPDEIARRIRELFEGKPSPTKDPAPNEYAQEEFLEEAAVLEMPPAVTPPAVPRTVEARPTKSELERSHRAVDGAYFHPTSLRAEKLLDVNVAAPHSWEIPEKRVQKAHTLDPRIAIQTMLILGPPRALASYDEDPLLSRYQSLV